ncbi:MAG TPA: TetR-like C-terminal domain-containing protein, partial [Acidimicrobiales bacterium]
AFAAEKSRHPELRDEFERVFVAERRARVRQLIARGVASGQLPASTDVELLAEAGFAILWHRLSLQRPLSPDLPERIVRQFLA